MADLTGTQWECRFCRHVWRGRVPHPPVRCPSCKRPKWETAPERGTAHALLESAPGQQLWSPHTQSGGIAP